MDEEPTEGRLLANFEKHDEFLVAQQLLLSVDLATEPSFEEDKRETELLGKLTNIVGRDWFTLLLVIVDVTTVR
jgi:tubulin-specific chaperone D